MHASVVQLEAISRWITFVAKQTNNEKYTFSVDFKVSFILTWNVPAKSMPQFVNGLQGVVLSSGRGPIGVWKDVCANRAHVVHVWVNRRTTFGAFTNQNCWQRLYNVDCGPARRHCWWWWRTKIFTRWESAGSRTKCLTLSSMSDWYHRPPGFKRASVSPIKGFSPTNLCFRGSFYFTQ